MFNFTTTTLIHSLDLFAANPTTTELGRTASALNGSYNTLWVNGVNLFRKENVVAIYRNPYIAPLAGRLVVDVNRILDELSKTIQATIVGKVHIRLKFSLRRTGDNNSYYARDEVFKGKDFVYEWIMTQTTTAADIAKQIKKINRIYGDVYLDVHVGTNKDNSVLEAYDQATTTSGTGDTSNNSNNSNNSGGTEGQPVEPGGSAPQQPEGEDTPNFGPSVKGDVLEMDESGKLVFVNDNYGLFTDAVLEYWQDGVSDCCHYVDGGWISFDQIEDYDQICVNNCSLSACDVITRGVKESPMSLLHIVDCVNGTGTYQQILKDLRLPTMENLAYGSLTQQMNEMPVPGMNYVQYTLHYVTCRGTLGGSAVGEVTHSKTTHVFFVPATCCSCESAGVVDIDAAFQLALKDAFGWEYCTGDEGAEGPNGRLVAAPHDDPTLAPNLKNQLTPAKSEDTRTNNDTTPATITEEIESQDDSGSTTSGGGGDTPSMPHYSNEGPGAQLKPSSPLNP